jgi:large subunit ribosomal protein L13
MSTTLAKPGSVKVDWHVVDASDAVLGRLAAKLAVILMGKHKVDYTPHVECGDCIVVLNADKVRVTGDKANVIEYDKYTRYAGGRRIYSFKRMHEEHPERLLQIAVKRMLPKNKLGRNMLTKLKIYRGDQHPHAAQAPKALKF